MMRKKWLAWLLGIALGVTGAVAAVSPAGAAVPDKMGFVLWNGVAPVATGTWPAGTAVAPQVPVGLYEVTFPGQAARGGVVHVTAINDSPHWCQAVKWGPSGLDEIVYIQCYQVGGAPAWTPFTAFFESSSGPGVAPFGYVDTLPNGALVSQYNAAGAGNVVVPLAVGQWHVRLPAIGSGGPYDGSVQVTAVDNGPARCKVVKWSSSAGGQDVLVYCFNQFGQPHNTRFTLTYQQKVSLYGAAFPPKYFGYLLWQPGAGPATTNFNSQLGFNANTPMVSGPGLVYVTFPRIGFRPDTVQVTAYGPGSEFCGLQYPWIHWNNDTLVRNVNCFTNWGAPVNTGFTVTANSRL